MEYHVPSIHIIYIKCDTIYFYIYAATLTMRMRIYFYTRKYLSLYIQVFLLQFFSRFLSNDWNWCLFEMVWNQCMFQTSFASHICQRVNFQNKVALLKENLCGFGQKYTRHSWNAPFVNDSLVSILIKIVSVEKNAFKKCIKSEFLYRWIYKRKNFK